MEQSSSSGTSCHSASQEISFMEPEGSLPCLQDLAPGPYNEPYLSSPQLQSYFRKTHATIILTSTFNSSKRSLSFRLSDQNFVRTSFFFHVFRSTRVKRSHVFR